MMYQVSITGRWYNQLIKYPPKVRYYLTILTVIVLVGSWYMAVYRPLGRAISYYERVNNQLRERFSQFEQERLTVGKLSSSISALEKDLVGYKSMRTNTNTIIGNLVEQAGNSHVNLESCTRESLVDHGWYQVQPIAITISGAAETVAGYVQSIAKSNNMCEFSQLSIAMSEDNIMRCQILVSHMIIR